MSRFPYEQAIAAAHGCNFGALATAWSALQVVGETWEDFPELKLWGLKRMFKYAVSPVQVFCKWVRL